MRKSVWINICALAILISSACTWAQEIEIVSYGSQRSSAKALPAISDNKTGVAVIFTGTYDLHYYADKNTAPGEYNLDISASAPAVEFDKPLFPQPKKFYDQAQQKDVQVYVGNFTIFIPIKSQPQTPADVTVTIAGIACTSEICLTPFEHKITTTFDLANQSDFLLLELQPQTPQQTSTSTNYSLPFALFIALIAGLLLNVMPCIWPVLPVIIMRLVSQSKEKSSKRILLGLAFCLGILLFFAALAALNIILQLFYGTVLQWGDQFRNPAVVASMVLLLVVLALFMFGLFTFSVPSSVASKGGQGKGFAGAIGMGFLAAILSTPCSFAILAAAFAWAQAQTLPLATLAIMTIGVGMALPYLILVSVPALLNRMPRAGQWMEIFKQAIGFVLLLIAVKLIAALPDEKIISVLYYAVILAFAVWMWGTWVPFGTKPLKKWIVRSLALLLVILAGWFFLANPKNDLIDWQPYDQQTIDQAIGQNRPVLIDFTADWCFNCIFVEKNVYSRKDIAELIKQKNVLPIKADTTTNEMPATKALRDLGETGVPVNLLFIPGQPEPIRWRGLSFAGELKEHLEKLPAEK